MELIGLAVISEKGESPTQALKREAFEEAKIIIHDDNLFLEWVIEIDNRDDVIARFV